METSRGIQGRRRAVQTPWEHRAALLALTLLFIATASCETQRVERKPTEAQRGADSSATATAGTATKPSANAVEASAGRHEARSTGPTTRVRLTQKGCVQFEPYWTHIRVGQSLTVQSDLKSPVTMSVSAGAFDRTEYVVRAGASMSTGPARSPGSYSIWTKPTACQRAPRGVEGSGPGVTVEGATRP